MPRNVSVAKNRVGFRPLKLVRVRILVERFQVAHVVMDHYEYLINISYLLIDQVVTINELRSAGKVNSGFGKHPVHISRNCFCCSTGISIRLWLEQAGAGEMVDWSCDRRLVPAHQCVGVIMLQITYRPIKTFYEFEFVMLCSCCGSHRFNLERCHHLR